MPGGLRRTGTTWSRWNRPRSSVRPGRNATDRPTSGGVFNDQKSSTYKLALLRTLVRIADGAGGFARPGTDDRHVDLPLGLVALFWIRAFKPLLASDFPQLPTGNGRLRFVKVTAHAPLATA